MGTAAAVLLLSNVTTVAAADPPAWQVATITRTKIKTPTTRMMSLTGCNETGARVAARNFLGVTLWAFELYVDYCYNGTQVLSPYMHTRGFAYMSGWSWQRTNNESWWGASLIYHNKWKALGEAEFKFCIPLVNCIQYSYPWIMAVVYGTGGVSFSGGA